MRPSRTGNKAGWLDMAKVPTVQVEHPDGYMVINESDFDPDVHELYLPPAPKPASKKKAAAKKKAAS